MSETIAEDGAAEQAQAEPSQPDAVLATATCNISFNGYRLHLNRGEPWAADDPVVAAYPDLFTRDTRMLRRSTPPLDERSRGVERATRAPGEKRRGKGRRRG